MHFEPHEAALWQNPGAWRPDLFSLGVSVAHYCFNNCFHSHWVRNLLISPASWHWDKLAPCQSPENLQCPSYSHPWDCSLVVCFGEFLQSFFVFISVDLVMMDSYCLHWRLLNFTSGRTLSSEPCVWTGILDWWPVGGHRKGKEKASCHHVGAQSLYSTGDPMKMPAARQTPLLRRNSCPIWASSHHCLVGAHPASFPSCSHPLGSLTMCLTEHTSGVGFFLSNSAFLLGNKWRGELKRKT